jgi:hypothetical protein
MLSFRSFALVMALATVALPAVQAQSSSSNAPAQDQAQPTTPQMNVQARIRARREQRRANAIREAYQNRWEVFLGMGYNRFVPGPNLQHVPLYAWDTALTRYVTPRFGVTADVRGYYGTPYVGLNSTGITRPTISHYDGLAGPVYRFYLQPKYSLSARVMGGVAHGVFYDHNAGQGGATLGLYADNSNVFAASASVNGEYNIAPSVAVRLSPELFITGFGSSTQMSRGFTGGVVYRFGK